MTNPRTQQMAELTDAEKVIKRQYVIDRGDVFAIPREKGDSSLGTLSPQRDLVIVNYSPTDMNYNVSTAEFVDFCRANGIHVIEHVKENRRNDFAYRVRILFDAVGRLK